MSAGFTLPVRGELFELAQHLEFSHGSKVVRFLRKAGNESERETVVRFRGAYLPAACLSMARSLIPELCRIWHRAKSDAIRDRLMAMEER